MLLRVIRFAWLLATSVRSALVPLSQTLGCHAASPLSVTIESTSYSTPFMSLRFSSFYLAPHDHLVVRPSDPDSTIPPVYFYPNQTFHSTYGLDAPPMATTRVVATLVVARPNSLATQSCVHISGYTAELERPQASEAICGVDRTQEAACYKLSAPSMFAKSNAVARLVINRDGNLTGCTGWLLGSEGHLVTNNHCIDEARQLVGIRIEFLAQTDKCPQSFLEKSCMRQLACTGEQWRGSTTFVYTNKALDYTLIQLTSTTGPNVATKYGFLRLRATGPQVGEPIYIVQHPQAWGKRISDKTATGRATVAGLNLLEAEYFLDTQAMSSGSPVVGVEDDAVVALHHAAYSTCPNLGVRSDVIVADLQAQTFVPQNGVLWSRNPA